MCWTTSAECRACTAGVALGVFLVLLFRTACRRLVACERGESGAGRGRRYTRLGATAMVVSRMGIGSGAYGGAYGSVDKAACVATVRSASRACAQSGAGAACRAQTSSRAA